MPSVDFDAVARDVRLADVLALLGWRHERCERADLLGWCPLCGIGKGWERCFRVREDRWVCYKCRRSGGALDLYQLAQGKPLLAAVKTLLAALGRPVPYRPRSKVRRPRPPRSSPRQG